MKNRRDDLKPVPCPSCGDIMEQEYDEDPRNGDGTRLSTIHGWKRHLVCKECNIDLNENIWAADSKYNRIKRRYMK